MALPVITKIANTFDGISKAYVYIWISKKWGVVYVGQTNDNRGTLGRAMSHIQNKGTLRTRFEERIGEELEKADDLVLLSFLLPQEKEFLSLESSYREAVEYIIQSNLQKERGNFTPVFRVISNVRYSERSSEKKIIKLAEDVLKQFREVYYSF